MRFAGVVLTALCAWWPILGFAQDTAETEKIADILVRLCVGGGHTEAMGGTAAGGGDLWLRPLDMKGNLKASSPTAALEQRRREQVPLDWAMTRNGA